MSTDAAVAVTPGRASSRPELAAGWYVALPSGRLGRRPVPLELFGTPVVAWRDGAGAPAVMGRRCPHQGADLSLGRVVEGSLRCPFHHWRFDAAGACVEASGAARIPAGARVRSYPVAERYGFVWAWYGGGEPLYDVPDFPALDGALGPVRRYGFSYRTPVPPRRVLENAFDPAHFRFVHGLPRRTSPEFSWLTDPAVTAVNGAPIGAGAWVGARLDVPMRPRVVPARMAAGLALSLVVDGWPGGQRLTFQLGDRAIAQELLAITPVRPGLTLFQGWTVMPRSRGPLGSAPMLWAYRYQHRQGTLQDLKIYREAAPTDGSVNEPQDQGVLRFRKYYEGWVERARELDE